METSRMETRWWESYLVRYLVGTITGAGIIYWLNVNSTSPLHTILIPNMTIQKELSTIYLFLLGAYGFAYCYIASGPMLVIHGTRGAFFDKTLKEVSKVIISAIIITCIVAFVFNKFLSISILASATFVFVVALQYIMLLISLTINKIYIKDYYDKLTRQRGNKECKDVIDEYVQSYRHLREHGNAFIILILEIILGFAIYNIPKVIFTNYNYIVGVIIVIWLIPAGFVWFVGTVLERNMAIGKFP
jgi:hypothetical protein